MKSLRVEGWQSIFCVLLHTWDMRGVSGMELILTGVFWERFTSFGIDSVKIIFHVVQWACLCYWRNKAWWLSGYHVLTSQGQSWSCWFLLTTGTWTSHPYGMITMKKECFSFIMLWIIVFFFTFIVPFQLIMPVSVVGVTCVFLPITVKLSIIKKKYHIYFI